MCYNILVKRLRDNQEKRKEVIKMTIMFLVVAIMIMMYFVVGMISIMTWEIVSSKTGACDVPEWLDNWYYFITTKWFFFFK